jgi:hypothetical protein
MFKNKVGLGTEGKHKNLDELNIIKQLEIMEKGGSDNVELS